MKKGTILTTTLIILGILVDVSGFFSLLSYAATPAFQLKLGEKYLNIGNYTEAILAFNKVIDISPGTADAYVGLSKAYVAKNNSVKAVEVLRRGLEHTDSLDIKRELDVLIPPDKPEVDESEAGAELVLPPPRTEGTGTLSGKVSAFINSGSSSVANASISVYQNDALLQTVSSDRNGDFSLDLEAGTYRLELSAEGFHPLTSEQRVTGNDTTYAQHFLLIDQQDVGNGIIGGTISDAATGRGVSGAVVRLYPNWNNPGSNNTAVSQLQAVTDGNGYYELNAPVGYYTASVEQGDFINAAYNVISVSGAPDKQQNISITKSVQMDQVRIVLRWGEIPSDLDSHLVVPLPDGGHEEVYYSHPRVIYNNVELANLDVDDTSSYGPETVTILKFDNSREYLYYVHDFSNGASQTSTYLGYSGATVSVYVGDSLYEEYSVPVGPAGCYWEVFKLDNDGIHPINTITGQLTR